MFVASAAYVSETMGQSDFDELLGADLSRWQIVAAQDGTFSHSDGILLVTGPNGWLKSDRQYSDFDLEVEFRFLTDDADSGVFFRAIGNEAFLRGWPNQSYQLQIRNPLTPSRFVPLGGLFRHGMPEARTDFNENLARNVTLGTGEWQRLEISVIGEQVTANVNGTPVLKADGIGNASGYIGLQGETNSLEFRSFKVRAR